MKKIHILTVLISLLLSSCVSIFSSRNSKVTLSSSTEQATIYSENKLLGKGNATSKFKKAEKSQDIVLKKPGYLDKNFAFNVQKKNPLRFANIISLPTLYGAYYAFLLDGTSTKRLQYMREVKVPAMVKEPAKRSENQKYLQLGNTSINLTKVDTLLVNYSNQKRFDQNKISSIESAKDDIVFEETVYSRTLTKFLKDYNFIDTTESIFPNYNNTSYISSVIEKVKFHTIGSVATFGGEIVYAEAQIKWILLDYYNVKLDSITITSNSDLFSVQPKIDDNNKKDDKELTGFIKSLNSAVELSLVELLSNNKFKKLTEKTEETNDFAPLKLKSEKYDSKTLNDLMLASVTVQTGKDSHGSGFLVSSDGYIITNYHVVANATNKKIKVILFNGVKYDAEIERVAPTYDLALIKIDATMLPHMYIKNYDINDIKYGSDVSTIGTPRSIELGQSVAKGIISGKRSPYQNVSYIQTSIPVNSGNSGGAFLDTKGNVIGVISSKLVGFGVEGIAFAIPSKYIFEALKIEY